MNLGRLTLDSIHSIHIIGIGGIGMSGLAKLLHQSNYVVQGSDVRENQQTGNLRKLGIKIFIGHNNSNIDGSQLIVKSSAIQNDNPEILTAKKKSIPVISRAELLSNMLLNKYNICITGAHGKTSTTSLIYSVLQHIKKEPTVICGGIINSINSNAYKGKSNINIVEADEADGTFLVLPTNIGIITNIDIEHLDYYRGIDNIIKAYKLFVEKVLLNDLLVVCDDCEYLNEINRTYSAHPKYITYGLNSKGADIKAANITQLDNGLSFEVLISEKFQQIIKKDLNGIQNVRLNNFGKHNVLNALASIAVAIFKRGKEKEIKTALIEAQGVARRFSIIGEVNGVVFVDDYAHHPREIQTTLEMAKIHASKNIGRIFAVSQPHRYSRFKELYNQFLESFEIADYLLVLDIYSAGEKEILGVSSKNFVEKIPKNIKAFYCKDNIQIREIIKLYCKPGDYIIFMGAGDISEIAHTLYIMCRRNNK